MSKFKITSHSLRKFEDAELELDKLREEYLLYHSQFVDNGHTLLCLWVKLPEGGAVPLGYAVI